MAITNELIIAVLGFLTVVVGAIGGIAYISRRQKNKNTSKTTVKQSGIGKVDNKVGDIGGVTFTTSQNANEGRGDESR